MPSCKKYPPWQGATQFPNCPPGKGHKNSLNPITCPASGCDISTCCEECSAGKSTRWTGAECHPCFAGRYSGVGATNCTNCPEGTHSSRGYLAAGSSSCTACAEGKYSNGGRSECITCSIP